MCSGVAAKVDAFCDQAAELSDATLRALLASFKYLKGLGLEVWDEAGLSLRSISQPGHMSLSSNALAQLHVLEGAASGLGLRACTRTMYSVVQCENGKRLGTAALAGLVTCHETVPPSKCCL